MKRIFSLLFFCCVLLVTPTGSAEAGLVLIVNPANSVDILTRRQLVDLYMGRYVAFPDGVSAVPLDQAAESSARKEFYKQLTGRRVAQINAYWAKLTFSGRATPPRSVDSSQAVLQVVSENPRAIGYVDESEVIDGVKVIGRLP